MNEPASIIVAGRATVDVIMKIDKFTDRPEKSKANDCRLVVGGPGANASIAISRFGGHSALVTYLGDDMMGGFIHQNLTDEAVDLSLCKICPDAKSSVSAGLLDKNGERQTFNFPGQGFSELPDISKLDFFPSAVLADNRHIELTKWAISLAQQKHLPMVIDAEAPFTEEQAFGATHLAFSMQGLESFAPGCDILTGLRQAKIATGCWVCVTDGEKGVWYLKDKLLRNIPAFPVNAIDTVGAGDVWHGAFTYAVSIGTPIVNACKYANLAASKKCENLGGIKATPYKFKNDYVK